MARRLPSLNALKVFESAGRHLSFTEAAEELNVTQAAVSRQIRSLEEWFDTKLFKRVHRGLELTPEGRTLLPTLTQSLDKIAAACASANNRARDLRVKIMPTFAYRWFLPRMPRFSQLQPDIDLRLTSAWRSVDFDIEDFDCGFSFGFGGWDGMHETKLLPELVAPICSPAFLKKDIPLKEPEDIGRHPLLHSPSHMADWAIWARKAGLSDLDTSQGQRFDTLDMAMYAAQAGNGIALGDYYLIQEELQTDRLVLPFPDLLIDTGMAYYFVCPEELAHHPKIEVFRSWILEEISQTIEAHAADAALAGHYPPNLKQQEPLRHGK